MQTDGRMIAELRIKFNVSILLRENKYRFCNILVVF